jgi:hypothetical protein
MATLEDVVEGRNYVFPVEVTSWPRNPALRPQTAPFTAVSPAAIQLAAPLATLRRHTQWGPPGQAGTSGVCTVLCRRRTNNGGDHLRIPCADGRGSSASRSPE